MYAGTTSSFLKCPRCSNEVRANEIFTKSDVLHLKPGIATCSKCGARFTYRQSGFRIFIIGLCLFTLTIGVSLFFLSDDDQQYFNATALTALAVLLVGLFGLQFGGLQLVE